MIDIKSFPCFVGCLSVKKIKIIHILYLFKEFYNLINQEDFSLYVKKNKFYRRGVPISVFNLNAFSAKNIALNFFYEILAQPHCLVILGF